jgi:GNAT superfamily N-acetyltransferase
VYRPGRVEDDLGATGIVAEAVGHLYGRHGVLARPPGASPANPFFGFVAEHAPDGFWIAEDDGGLVGVTISVVHGPLWYLGFLFLRPGTQYQGVGRHLIELGLAVADKAGATNRALVTFAFNRVSIALYLRYGLYPREPLYAVAGSASAIATMNRAESDLPTETIGLEAQAKAQLGDIDEQAVGVRRDLLHRFLLSRPDGRCLVFLRAGAVAEYSYVWSNGRVGPEAVGAPADLDVVMRAALVLTACQAGVEQVTAAIVPAAPLH